MKISLRQGMAIAWSFLILLLCTLPSKSLPQAPQLGLDKGGHFGLFAIWSWLWLRACPKRGLRIWVLGLAFAILTEVAQASLSRVFEIDRSADWADALADGLGLTLVLIIARLKPAARTN